jgi:hypothetical protein
MVVTSTGSLTAGGPRLRLEAGQESVSKGTGEDNKNDNNKKTFKLNKIAFDSEGKVYGEMTMYTSKNSKLYVCAEDERQEPGRPIKSFGTIGSNFSTTNLTIDTSVDIVNGPTSRSWIYYHYQPWNLKIGSEIQINSHFDDAKDANFKKSNSISTNAGSGINSNGSQQVTGNGNGNSNGGNLMEIENFNVGMAFSGKSYTFSAKTNDKCGSISFGYHHQINPFVAIGTIVNYGLTSNAQNLLMGCKINLDKNNIIKMKMNSAGEVSGTLNHRLNSFSTFDISAKANLHQTTSTSQKIGIGFAFDPR